MRQALGVEKLTLFGISYGTKLALAYARAHPEHVERIALDSVLEPDDPDAFGREPYQAMGADAGRAVPGALPRRDRRSGRRPRAAGRPAARRAAARRDATGPAAAGTPGTLTALALSDLMFDSDYNPAIRAGVPVAVRAALDHGDAAPLLRLVDAAADLSRLPPARVFSAARYATVCEETPLPWPRGAPFGERAQRAREQAAALGPGAFFPFAYEEAKADEIDLCLRWAEASAPPPTGGAYPAVPALVLQGGEDLRTPPAGSARVAAALGAQRVVVPGVGHAVVGGDPSRCGIRRLFAFLRGRPAAAACPRVPTEVPATGVPPTSLSQLGGAGRRARAGGADGGGARRHARRPHLRALAGPGLAAGGRGAARRELPPAPARDRPGRACRWSRASASAAGCRGAGARACGSRAGARPAAGCGSRRRGVVRGRLGGRSVRGRLRAGPPRPVASGARSVAKTARFRHRTALSSVRRPT